MKSFNPIAIVSLSILISACTGQTNTSRELSDTAKNKVVMHHDNYVSMISLIGNPEKYNHKRVHVTGFLTVEFEGSAFYLHEEDYKLGIGKNAVWAGLTGKQLQIDSIKKCDKQYVFIEGTFNSTSNGMNNYCSGSIDSITLVKAINSPANN